MLDRQLRAAQEDPRKAVLLIVRGPLGAQPEVVLTCILDLVSSRLQLSLHHGSASRTLQRYQWLKVRDGRDDWMGNVRIQLDSLEEVQALYAHLQGKVITVDGKSRFLEIHNVLLFTI